MSDRLILFKLHMQLLFTFSICDSKIANQQKTWNSILTDGRWCKGGEVSIPGNVFIADCNILLYAKVEFETVYDIFEKLEFFFGRNTHFSSFWYKWHDNSSWDWSKNNFKAKP